MILSHYVEFFSVRDSMTLIFAAAILYKVCHKPRNGHAIHRIGMEGLTFLLHIVLIV